MNIKRNKTKTIAVTLALVLTITITATLLALPVAVAHDPPWTIPSWTYCVVTPNPVGVGQQVVVAFWREQVPDTASGAYGDRWIFYLDITKPDNSEETLGPFTSDPVGGAYSLYIPDQVGTYYFVARFPGQTLANDNPNPSTTNPSPFVGDYYEPSNSGQVPLIVQQDPIQVTPEVPLPTDYWQRPINGENREWSTISGNWLMAKYDKDAVGFEYSGNWNPYTTAPNSAHILWTKELTFGGIAGGNLGVGLGYYMGLQYEPKLRPPIIINGILYHDIADPPRYGFEAVNLRTGETIWHQNSSYQLSFGQVLDYESPNQHGAIPYLWSRRGSTWHMFDAFTGNYILSIENVPSVSYMVMGPHGEILVYTLNTRNHWLSMWNSTKAIPPASETGSGAWQWRPDNYRGETLDGTVGIQWNVTGNTAPSGSGIRWYWNGILISMAVIQPTTADEVFPTLVHTAFNATTGEQIWQENRTDMGVYNFAGYVTPNEGVYAVFVRETKQWVAWNVTTGSEMWRTDPIENDWGFYEYTAGFAYGRFYSAGYAGTVHAYDASTGEHLWDYYAGDAGFDTPYGSWPFFGANIIADGKIIVGTNEHSPSMPLWRGEKLHVIDAITGEGVWNVSGIYSAGRNGLGAIADGYLVTMNGYDNQIYCFGKGLTATTVSASPKVTAHGNSVLIEGTVTDQSPGDTCLGIPAAGTPAIADEYMTEWMEYLYMQHAMPMDATGVEVVLEALYPDGSFNEIGRVTSDASGMFKMLWEPPDEGEYTIVASFAGSESYWRSTAETAIGVTEAPSPGVEPTTEPPTTAPPTSAPPTGEAPLITTEVAIIAAVVIIAVIAIAAYWVMRRRQIK